MIEESTLSDGTIEYEWPTGYAQVKRLAPGVVFFRKVGFFPASAYAKLVRPFEEELRSASKLVMVCDCAEMTNYDSAYRLSWTEWFKAAKGRVRAHIFTQSRFVRMAISVVNLVVQVFTPHQSLAGLEGVLRELVPGYSTAMLPRAKSSPESPRAE